jgi:hypothetical protein
MPKHQPFVLIVFTTFFLIISMKQVLGLDDGLWSPRGIHYNRSRDILLVANEVGSVFMYNFNLHV